MGGSGPLNQRRSLTLLLAIGDRAGPVGLRENRIVAPFDHHDRLPDLHPTAEFSPTVISLDEAFRRLAPDRYLGVLRD
jgi:hypothetical protein